MNALPWRAVLQVGRAFEHRDRTWSVSASCELTGAGSAGKDRFVLQKSRSGVGDVEQVQMHKAYRHAVIEQPVLQGMQQAVT